SVVENANALANECLNLGMKLQTGGTDNHLMLIDVSTYGLTGKQAEAAMFSCGITLNANSLPFDKNGPWWTSGIRVGTPALTTLGMNTSDMKEVANLLHLILSKTKPGITKDGKPAKGKFILDAEVEQEARTRVKNLLAKYVLYPELDLDFLKKEF
ncbi:MAG: glycine hydroxymethyltransferase, partial [Treponema sp.]|nr:glycine hydroxymethyltransferase [Treponema sp.]